MSRELQPSTQQYRREDVPSAGKSCTDRDNFSLTKSIWSLLIASESCDEQASVRFVRLTNELQFDEALDLLRGSLHLYRYVPVPVLYIHESIRGCLMNEVYHTYY